MSDIARHMGAVARHLWGDPNPRLSRGKELRWGNQGSRSVDLEEGVWYDHEADDGGGVLDLIKRETGAANGAAFDWLRSELGIEIGEPPSKREIVATYSYCDEDGGLL